MKILFVVYELGQTYSPTTKIVHSIANEFVDMGVECHLLGQLSSGDALMKTGRLIPHPFKMNYDVLTNERLQKRMAFAADKSFPSLRKIWICLSQPLAVARLVLGGAFLPWLNSSKHNYAVQIKKITKEQQFDAVIAIYFPVAILQAIAAINIGFPLFLYQLDPWALHESDYPETPKVRECQEKKAFKKARYIFTTPVLLQQYKQSSFSPFVHKMTAVDFPNITDDRPKPDAPSLIDFPQGQLTLLYTGSIADDYRSPDFFLQVMDVFWSMQSNARIVFMGNNYSPLLTRYALQHPNRVTLIPPQDGHVAKQAMQKADVLVNIGNIFKYQVPSKLIDYLGAGRPIVSTCKMRDCPTLPYMHKYPLGLVLFEDENPQVAAEKIFDFCSKTLGQTLPYPQVELLYKENTPKFVARTMMTGLQNFSE